MKSPAKTAKKAKTVAATHEAAADDDAPDMRKALDQYASFLPARSAAALRRRIAEDSAFAQAAEALLNRLGEEVAKCAVLPDGDYEIANNEPREAIAMDDPDLAAMVRFFLVESAEATIADMGLPADLVQESALERLRAAYEKHAAAAKKPPAKRARASAKKAASPAKSKASNSAMEASAKKPAPSATSANAGKGCWVAKTMEIEWPGREPDLIEAVGIYNTVTKEFKLHETVGEALEQFVEDNPEQDYYELLASYEREAEDWATAHNMHGL